MLQLLKILQLQQVVLTADLRERSAECAKYAAKAANAAVKFSLLNCKFGGGDGGQVNSDVKVRWDTLTPNPCISPDR